MKAQAQAQAQAQAHAQAAKAREVRLFVSSTFLDLEEERAALSGNAFPRLRNYCAARGIVFTPVDLRWGVTDEECTSGRFLELCLSEVERCRPYFLCLVGDRYGWHVPPGAQDGPAQALAAALDITARRFPWVQAFSGCSVTQLEVLCAHMSTPREQQRHFFYMRNPLYATYKFPPGDVRRQAFEPESEYARNRLQALKEWIYDNHDVRTDFDTPEQLCDWVVEDLQAALREDFPEDTDNVCDDPFQEETACAFELVQSSHAQFVGREDVLVELNAFVRGSEEGVLVLKGHPGIGKSTLLAEFAFQLQNTESFTVVPFLTGTPSRNPRSYEFLLRCIAQQFAGAAAAGDGGVPGACLEVEEVQSRVLRALQTSARSAAGSDATFPRPLVFLLDGVDELEGAPASLFWLTRIPPNRRVKVIVSLNDTCAPPLLESVQGLRCMSLETLLTAERAQLVVARLTAAGKKLTSAQQEVLTRAAGTGSPLFLTCGIDFLCQHATYGTLDGWLHELSNMDSVAELLHTQAEYWEGEHGDWVTLALAVLALSPHGVGIADVAQLTRQALAHVVPFWEAVGPFCDTRGGLARLKHASLAEAVVSATPPSTLTCAADRYLAWLEAMPACVRKAVEMVHLVKATKTDAHAHRLRDLLCDPAMLDLLCLPAHRPMAHSAWRVLCALHPSTNIERCVTASLDSRGGRALEELAGVLRNAAEFLAECGCAPAAAGVAEKFATTTKALHGRTSTQYGHALVLLTELRLVAGVCDEDSALAALKILATRLGDSHPSLAPAYSCHALLLKKKGNYAQAHTQYQRALRCIESSSDPLMRARFITLAGDVLRKQGRAAEAVRRYTRAVDVIVEAQGNVSPHLILPLRSLGVVHKKMGEYSTAASFLSRAMELLEDVHGPDHPDYTLLALDLADVHRKQGRYDLATAQYHRTLSVLEERFGPDHPEIGEVLNSLGLVHKKQSRYVEAREAYQRALRVVQAAFGSEHYKCAVLRCNVGDVERKLGNYSAALEIYAVALSCLRASLGDAHPEVAEVLNSIGLVYKKMAQYDEAERCYREAIGIIEAEYGHAHVKRGLFLNNLADVYRKRKCHAEGLCIYEQARGIIGASLGAEHSEVAEVLHNMALVRVEQGEYATASSLLDDALRMVHAELGPAHPKSGLYRATQGALLAKMGNTSGAERALQAALRILRAALGPRHPEVADVLVAVGDLCVSMHVPQRAVRAWQRAHAIILHCFGPTHPKASQIAESLAHIGGSPADPADTVSMKAQSVRPGSRKTADRRQDAASQHAILVNWLMMNTVMNGAL